MWTLARSSSILWILSDFREQILKGQIISVNFSDIILLTPSTKQPSKKGSGYLVSFLKMDLQLLASCMELERSHSLQASAVPKVICLPFRALCLPGTSHNTVTSVPAAHEGQTKAWIGDLSRGTHLSLSSANNCPQNHTSWFLHDFISLCITSNMGSMNLATRRKLENSFLLMVAAFPRLMSKKPALILLN